MILPLTFDAKMKIKTANPVMVVRFTLT